MGYTELWFWNSPAFFKVCFSSQHGLFSWTPILLFAVAGFFASEEDTTARWRSYLAIVFVAYLT